jgi:hypothetical protein
MPLPERPNVGEFYPTVEPVATRKRKTFRWRIIPATLLLIPAAGCLFASTATLVHFFADNELAEMWRRPYNFTQAEWLVFNARTRITFLLLAIAATLWGIGACLLMRNLLKGHWWSTAVLTMLLFATPVITFFAVSVLVPHSAEAIARAIYHGQRIDL